MITKHLWRVVLGLALGGLAGLWLAFTPPWLFWSGVTTAVTAVLVWLLILWRRR